MVETIDNINIYPTRQRIDLNDKATKNLFNLTPDKFEKLVKQGATFGVVETKRKNKKTGKIEKIVSGYTLTAEKGFTFIAPLGEYERALLNVCVSEYDNGAEYITLAALQRGLAGKNCDTKDHRNAPYKDQSTRLNQALDMLMACQYDPDILEVFEKLDYEGAENIQKAQILPAERLEKIVGGKKIEVIHFLGESPLAKIAKAKKQILTYDAELLDVPNQQNTPLIIMLKNYSLRRVLESIKHKKQFKPILTLDDIFKKCRIENAHREIKRRAREYLEEFFKHLQSKGVIKSFEFIKKGNKFYAVKFTF